MGGLITSNVILSDCVIEKITELELYLKNTLKFSKEAAKKRTDRMGDFLESLDGIAVYPLCRFLRWRVLGYHCVVFEKDWVLLNIFFPLLYLCQKIFPNFDILYCYCKDATIRLQHKTN